MFFYVILTKILKFRQKQYCFRMNFYIGCFGIADQNFNNLIEYINTVKENYCFILGEIINHNFNNLINYVDTVKTTYCFIYQVKLKHAII